MDPYCHGFCQQVRHVAGVTIVRTAFEDRVLQEELEGYEPYARRVRYRLLPCIW